MTAKNQPQKYDASAFAAWCKIRKQYTEMRDKGRRLIAAAEINDVLMIPCNLGCEYKDFEQAAMTAIERRNFEFVGALLISCSNDVINMTFPKRPKTRLCQLARSNQTVNAMLEAHQARLATQARRAQQIIAEEATGTRLEKFLPQGFGKPTAASGQKLVH